jgi:tRNA dimethylallyltransferase
VSVGGEIVNFDSRQFYAGLDVGTDKTPLSARRGVPHHGLDLLPPAESMSAGKFLELAAELVSAIVSRGRIPIFVGGTGFYLRVLREGLSPLPPAPERLRRTVKRVLPSGTAAHRWLSVLDSGRAEELPPADRDRVVRAVEVVLMTGRPMSAAMREARAGGLSVRWIVLGCRRERPDLHARIDARVGEMLRGGLLEEAARCLRSGVPAEAPGLSAIGYSEAIRCLRGELPPDRLREAIVIRTRQYAKRQETWFRREAGIVWLPETDGDRLAVALSLVRTGHADAAGPANT